MTLPRGGSNFLSSYHFFKDIHKNFIKTHKIILYYTVLSLYCRYTVAILSLYGHYSVTIPSLYRHYTIPYYILYTLLFKTV